MDEGQGVLLPRALFDVLCLKHEGLVLCLGAEHDVIDSASVAKAAGPGTDPVFVLAVFQTLLIPFTENLIDVVHDLPIHQVPGFHNGHAWVHMHGGTAHVICIAHPDHAGVRNVRPDDGILSIQHGRNSFAGSISKEKPPLMLNSWAEV